MIIFFDGVCNLCNGFVSILVKLDKKKKFHFAPLQGSKAKELNLDFSNLDLENQTIFYLDNDNSIHKSSNAVIHILKDLFVFGHIFLIFKLVPQSLRDKLYSFVAKNRYRVFGKQNTCRVPNKDEKTRFYD